MQYTQNQIRYILKSGGHNIHNAIIKDGRVFINDITLAPNVHSDDIEFIYRGKPINLSMDDENRRRAANILQRAYNIDGRRQRIRGFFQNLSDKLTANHKLEQMSDLEIRAWFALDKIARNKNKITVDRIGYMYNIRLSDIVLSHIPANEPDRRFIMLFNDKDLLSISPISSNPYLYNRASDVFFSIYSGIVKHGINTIAKSSENSR